MTIRLSAFRWVPPFAQGYVRDLRVRWALEEAGLPYMTHLLELGDQDKPDYRTATSGRAPQMIRSGPREGKTDCAIYHWNVGR